MSGGAGLKLHSSSRAAARRDQRLSPPESVPLFFEFIFLLNESNRNVSPLEIAVLAWVALLSQALGILLDESQFVTMNCVTWDYVTEKSVSFLAHSRHPSVPIFASSRIR